MADNRGNIVIGVDNGDAIKKLNDTANKAKELGKAAEDSGKKIDEASKKTVKSVDEQKKAIDTLNEKLKALKKAAADAFNSGNDSEYVKKKKEAQELEIEIGNLTKEMRAQIKAEAEEAAAAAEAAKHRETLRTKLRKATLELAELLVQYRALSEEEQKSESGKAMLTKIQTLTTETGALKDAMDDASTSIKNSASDTSSFDAISQALNVASSAAGAYVGALGLMGVSEEKQQDIQTKLQASLAISNALTVTQTALQKQSALMLGISALQAKAAAKAISIKTAAEGKSVIVTKAATIAQAAFNKVASANPYVILALAFLTVVGAITAFASGQKKATDATKKQNEELKRQQEYINDVSSTAAKSLGKYTLLVNSYGKLRTQMQRTKFIKDNAEAFKELGLKIKNVADAEELLKNNTKDVVAAFMARAQAMASENAIIKAYEKYNKAKLNNTQRWQSTNKKAPTQEELEAVGAEYELEAYNGLYGVTYEKVYKRTEEVDEKVNNLRNANALKQIDKRHAKAKETLDKELKGYIKLYEEAQNKLAKYNFFDDGKDKTDNSQKIASLRDTIKKARYAVEMGVKEAEVKAMQEGEEKVLAQMELNHKQELDKLEQEKQEYIKKQNELAKLTGKKYDKTNDPTLKQYEQQVQYLEQVYNQSLSNVLQSGRTALNEYLAENGTYVEQITATMALYEEKMKAANEGEKTKYMSEMENKIQEIKEKFGVSTSAFADLMADMSKSSTKEIQRIIDKYKLLISYIENGGATGGIKTDKQTTNITGVTVEDLKIAGFTDDELQKVKEGKVNVDELRDAVLNLVQADETLTTAFQKAFKEITDGSIEKGVKQLSEVTEQVLGDITGIANQLGEAFGANMDNFNSVVEGLQGINEAARGAAQIASGDVAGGVIAVTGGIASVVSAIAAIGDKSHENSIKAITTEIDNLNREYEKLQKLVDKTFSYDKATAYEQEIANIQRQIELTQQAIGEEQSKKNSDSDRINEWKASIEDMQEQIRELEEATKDAIFGEDIQAQISSFAQAYADAWSNGTSRAKTAKEQVRAMMQSMVQESIQAAIQSTGAMERIRDQLLTFYSDGVLSAWEQNYVEQMATELQRDLDDKFGWADRLLSNNSADSASSGGFATASQDSVDELNGRFTAVQMNTSSIVESLAAMNEAVLAQVDHMANVRANTEQSVSIGLQAVDYLGSIEKNTRELYTISERLEKIEANTSNI